MKLREILNEGMESLTVYELGDELDKAGLSQFRDEDAIYDDRFYSIPAQELPEWITPELIDRVNDNTGDYEGHAILSAEGLELFGGA